MPTPEELIDASDPQAVTDIVARRGTGFWRRDGFRDPKIEMETAGIPWQVEFYGCRSGSACTDLRFVSRLADGGDVPRASPNAVASWNAENRFGKVSRNSDDALILEYNSVLAGGVSRQNFDLTLDWWLVALKSFHETFGS
ncbi:MAG: YbjN domain-containing protein [Pseudomonadota bacterium]